MADDFATLSNLYRALLAKNPDDEWAMRILGDFSVPTVDVQLGNIVTNAAPGSEAPIANRAPGEARTETSLNWGVKVISSIPVVVDTIEVMTWGVGGHAEIYDHASAPTAGLDKGFILFPNFEEGWQAPRTFVYGSRFDRGLVIRQIQDVGAATILPGIPMSDE